ncbi:MAG: hypothetical protein F6K50_12900, partial [Moorea sp. SIO3I7]|nr:hypothetical protein [Moorena sp. SIO3I7]
HNPIETERTFVNQEITFPISDISRIPTIEISEESKIELPVTVNEQVAGNWRFALAKDDEVRRHLGKPGLLEAFKKSPATGCITVMDMARISSGFNPFNPLYPGNFQAFLNYINTIKKSPFFEQISNDYQRYHRKNNDWNGVINAISSYYKGITFSDRFRIRMSLYRLIRTATSRRNTWQSQTLFAQNTVKADQDGIIVYIYNSNVSLKEGRRRKRTTTEVHFNISRITLKFYFERWAYYAEEVADKHIKLVRDWLNENSNKSRKRFYSMDENDASCLDEIPSVVDAIKSGDVNEYWSSFQWDDFNPHIQNLWSILGWNDRHWEASESAYPPSHHTAWDELTAEKQKAAKELGYNETNWNCPSVAEAIRCGNVYDYWNRFGWDELSPYIQSLWAILGWNNANWEGPKSAYPASEYKTWDELTPEEQQAAKELGYIKAIWDQ